MKPATKKLTVVRPPRPPKRVLSSAEFHEASDLISALTAATRMDVRIYSSVVEQGAATAKYEAAFLALMQWVAERTVF